MKKENSAWSLITTMIASAAAREGVPQWRLEAIFGVGDGSGRVWRAWMRGERVARRLTYERIISAATARGWFMPTDNQRADIEALPDEAIYMLAGATPCPIEPPDPPDCELTAYTARIAAAALFKDAEQKDGRLAAWRERTIKPEVFRGVDLRIADGTAWRAAVQFVRDTPPQHHATLKAQIIIAYRRRGYQ